MKLDTLDFTIPTTVIKLGNEQVSVRSYLTTKEKIELIEAIKMECFNTDMIDQVKIDSLFNAFIILNYIDIEFEDRDLDSLIKLYDYFEVKGYMTLIINAIPKVEYNALNGYLQETINDFNKYKVSLLGTIESIMAIAPALMERVSEISKDINIDDLKTIGKIYSEFK